MAARAVAVAALGVSVAACQEPLEIRYETEHLRIGTNFDEPLCRGDLDHFELVLTTAETALGADVTVPTLDGDAVTIRVPAGTRSGRTFRVRGKGVATPKTTGDLLVTIEIDVPTEIGDDERVALEALAAARTGPSPRAHLEV